MSISDRCGIAGNHLDGTHALMKEQNINLYQRDLEPPKIFLSFLHMVELAGLFFIVLMLATAYMFYDFVRKQEELELLAKQEALLKKNLNQEQSQVPTEADRERLIKEVRALEKDRETRQKMYSTLSSLQYGTSEGFSAHLGALAKQTLPGISLSKFRLSAGGSHVSLEGQALKGRLIPELIHKLGEEQAFDGTTFEIFRLVTDPKLAVVNFVLESESE